MKNKLFGDAQVIRKAQAAPAGDRSVYINFDAIKELPDEYEVVVTEIKFDPKNLKVDFSEVGNGMYMPSPQLMYRIAEACGISGGDNSISEPIIEEVDINPMLCKKIEETPTYRKMTVGRKVIKYSVRIQEDGTLQKSSVCTSAYNVWERCLTIWSDEELDTNGYKDIKTGKYTAWGKEQYGDYVVKGAYSYPVKYNTPLKRKAFFDSEMKFAHAKAETKAHEKTIRELAGLVTGYKAADLASGSLIFSKVRRSREVLQMETAARLSALSQGKQLPGPADNTLFGSPPPDIQPENSAVETVATEEEFKAPFADPPVVQKTKREELISTLQYYQSEKLIMPEYEESIASLVAWLEANKEAEADINYWPKAIAALKVVEAKIPDEGKLSHGLLE